MMHTISRRAAAATAAAAIAATLLAPISVGNTFAASLLATTSSPSLITAGSTTQALTLTIDATTDTLAAGEKIIITVPDTFGNFASLASANVSVNGGSITNTGTKTFDATARTITYTLAGGESATAANIITVVIGGSGQFLTIPSTAGQYSIALATQTTAGATVETGAALIRVANQVGINVNVNEALVMSIDQVSMNLEVDPSTNSGKDYSNRNVLTVSTNAVGGYVVQAELDDANNTANLKRVGSADVIPTGNFVSTANRFGYVAYNTNQTRTQAQIEAETPQAFSATPATILASGGGNVGFSGVTNSQSHTIYYGVRVDYTSPAGQYAGTITYTALPSF